MPSDIRSHSLEVDSFATAKANALLLKNLVVEDVIELTRRLRATKLDGLAASLLTDLLIDELERDQRQETRYERGSLTRQVLLPLGIDADAPASNGRPALRQFLPIASARLADVAPLRSIVVAQLEPLPVRTLAAERALSITTGATLASALAGLRARIQTEGARLREAELCWLGREVHFVCDTHGDGWWAGICRRALVITGERCSSATRLSVRAAEAVLTRLAGARSDEAVAIALARSLTPLV